MTISITMHLLNIKLKLEV